ncbi:MAG: TM2 domain-containing protein [Hyphomicrobiales bacterium]
MKNILQYLPEITGEEYFMLTKVCEDFNDGQMKNFAMVYRSRRKDPMIVLVAAIIGLMGFAGIHRILTNNIVLGLVYFFTCGFCFIGTIVDIINYEQITLTYNTQMAYEIRSCL